MKTGFFNLRNMTAREFIGNVLFWILLILVLGMISGVPLGHAANHFVWSGATGNNDGTDLTNAFENLGDITGEAAGDSVWIAGGNYTETLNITTSGTEGNPIVYLRITAADLTPVNTDGYTADMDSCAHMDSCGVILQADYIEINGQEAGGIHIWNPTAPEDYGTGTRTSGINVPTLGASNVTLRYLKIEGTGYGADLGGTITGEVGIDYTPSSGRSHDVTIEYCEIFNTVTGFYPAYMDSNLLVQYNEMYQFWESHSNELGDNPHENIIIGEDVFGATIRYNYFHDWAAEGVFIRGDQDDWDVYGNIFDTGNLGIECRVGYTHDDINMYNNTFVDVYGPLRYRGTDTGYCYNNLMYYRPTYTETKFATAVGSITHDYNWWGNETAGGEAHGVAGRTENPFIDVDVNYEIVEGSSAINAGTDLSAIFTLDYDGDTYDTPAYTIGAQEYSGATGSSNINVYLNTEASESGDGTSGSPFNCVDSLYAHYGDADSLRLYFKGDIDTLSVPQPSWTIARWDSLAKFGMPVITGFVADTGEAQSDTVSVQTGKGDAGIIEFSVVYPDIENFKIGLYTTKRCLTFDFPIGIIKTAVFDSATVGFVSSGNVATNTIQAIAYIVDSQGQIASIDDYNTALADTTSGGVLFDVQNGLSDGDTTLVSGLGDQLAAIVNNPTWASGDTIKVILRSLEITSNAYDNVDLYEAGAVSPFIIVYYSLPAGDNAYVLTTDGAITRATKDGVAMTRDETYSSPLTTGHFYAMADTAYFLASDVDVEVIRANKHSFALDFNEQFDIKINNIVFDGARKAIVADGTGVLSHITIINSDMGIENDGTNPVTLTQSIISNTDSAAVGDSLSIEDAILYNTDLPAAPDTTNIVDADPSLTDYVPDEASPAIRSVSEYWGAVDLEITLEITSPALDDTLTVDDVTAITWTAANIDSIILSYSTDGLSYTDIVRQAYDDATYNWTVVSGAVGSAVLIKAVSTVNDSIYVISDAFTVGAQTETDSNYIMKKGSPIKILNKGSATSKKILNKGGV